MFQNIKLIVIGGIVIVIIGILFGGYYYVTNLSDEKNKLQSDNILLQDSIQIQKEALKKQQEEIDKKVSLTKVLQKKNIKLKEVSANYSQKLSQELTQELSQEFDIEKSTHAGSITIRPMINTTIENLFHCFEKISSSKTNGGEDVTTCQDFNTVAN